MVQIIIADARDVVIDGIKTELYGDSIDIAGVASNGKEVLRILTRKSIDVVVISINLPVLNGIETAEAIRLEYPKTKVLLRMDEPSKEEMRKVLLAKVKGCMLLNAEKEELMTAIKTVAAGNLYYSPQLLDIIVDDIVPGNDLENAAEDATELDKKIVQYISDALTSKEIGQELFLSEDTISSHRKAMLRKYNVKNGFALVKLFLKRGWIN